MSFFNLDASSSLATRVQRTPHAASPSASPYAPLTGERQNAAYGATQTPYQRSGFATTPAASSAPTPTPASSFGSLSWSTPAKAAQSPHPVTPTVASTTSPAPTAYAAFNFRPFQSTPSSSAVRPYSSGLSSPLSGVPPSASSVPQATLTPAAAAAARTTNTTNGNAKPNTIYGPTQTANFSDPNIDRIAAQLHAVQRYKTPGALVLSSLLLMAGVVALVYGLLAPMPLFVPVLGVFPVPRAWFQLVLLCAGSLLTYVGLLGVHGYTALQLPAQALDGLTEKQKRLMGWTAATGGSANQHTYREEQERAAANGALRRRREQITPAAPVQPASTSKPAIGGTAGASGSRSPIPTASLRFLDPRGPSSLRSPPSTGGFHSSMGSPFRTRGLDLHHVQDDRDLQELISTRTLRDDRHGAATMTPVASNANRYGSVGGTSPRGGSTGFHSPGVGFGVSPYTCTPPYHTSSREVLSTLVVPAASTTSGSTQPYTYPGLRHTLDDPRADADIHDLFPTTTLAQVRQTTADLDQSVRRVRAWIVSTILRPFLRALDDTTLRMCSLSKLVLAAPGALQSFTRDEVGLLREMVQLASDARGGPIPLTARVEEAIQLLRGRFPKRSEVAARATVDFILSVATPGQTVLKVSPQTKEFVARRIATLCAPGDDSLSKYSVANTGAASMSGASVGFGVGGGLVGHGSGFGMGSSVGLFGQSRSAHANQPAAGPLSTYPTDAQIIMHAFCAHMESVMTGFTMQYVRDEADTAHGTAGVAGLPTPTDGAACIVQVRPAHLSPYYIVARPTSALLPSSSASSRSSSGPVKFLTEPGRPSLFQALVLWIIELPVGSRLGREFTGIIAD